MTDVGVSSLRCPSCKMELQPNAVLCVHCGFHLQKGQHLSFATSLDEPIHLAPQDETLTDPPYLSTFGLFWIEGRISRMQWWIVYLIGLMIFMAIGALLESRLIGDWIVFCLLPVFWVMLVAQIKRWHDMDKSGFWCLVNLLPIVGSIYALIELGLQKGTTGWNSYGNDPLPKG
jgi:uncharacterized membrane protein YhaH (DUF805 family)